jgi:hypothetical protein
VDGRKIIPIPMLKRKLRIRIRADEWAGGDVNQEIELPKRVWTGRNSGVMFKVLFVDPGSEYAGREQDADPGTKLAGSGQDMDAHRLG